MENKPIARTLRFLSQLMELHAENGFKVRSVANAAFKVDKLPYPIASKSLEEIEKIDGIGKSIAAKIWEYMHTETIAELEDLLKLTPPGVVDIMKIKGIGPKKVVTIWKDLDIESIGELYYACNENRLIEAKGFGLKTQEDIKKAIEFQMASNGKFLYAQVEQIADELHEKLAAFTAKFSHELLLSFAGPYRRRYEIIEQLDFVIATANRELLWTKLLEFELLSPTNNDDNSWKGITAGGLNVAIHFSTLTDFYQQLFILTGSETHTEQVLKLAGTGPFENEQAIYSKAGLDFIEPELREGTNEIELAQKHQLPTLITYADLKGTLHNHSTWSDGVHTLEEMALYCRDTLKLEYLGMCDHSKSAFYANGLREERVLQQQQEIDALNIKLAPFKIFKGIESDILNDGNLDYSNDVLDSFDFIVASVHANLKMNEEKATARLLTAIENPYTTILGHPTGRLLLSRSGYPIDHKKIIDACAANGVAIEINANPLRLDLDWRWQQYALEKGVMLSINPDAHRKEGFHDMHYGVLVARKGGLSVPMCLNAMNLETISAYFAQQRTKR